MSKPEIWRKFLSVFGGLHTEGLAAGRSGHGLRVVLPARGQQGTGMHVGTLRREGDEYVFVYSLEFKGRPIPSFPQVGREYRSKALWPFFAVRLPPTNREDVKRVLAHRQVDVTDELRLLEVLGKRTATTPYELVSESVAT